MRQPSKHYNMQHPATGAVACPICFVPAGSPCITTSKARINGERTETHVTRVKLFEREQRAQDVRAGEFSIMEDDVRRVAEEAAYEMKD